MPSITSFSLVTVGYLVQGLMIIASLSVLTLFSRDLRFWWTRRGLRREALRRLVILGTIRKMR